MQITIFGANGRVGRLVVDLLLRQDHTVVAFVHSKSSLAENPKLRIAKGDIYDAETVGEAVKGSDLVISTLGSWGTAKKDILTAAMRNIIPAMEASGARRIISLTGSDASATGDTLTLLHRLSHAAIGLTPGLRKILADGDRHIQLLEASGLDWTVVRSPVMNERGKPEDFELVDRRPTPWATINRRSVALSLVNLIDDTNHNRKAPFIVRA